MTLPDLTYLAIEMQPRIKKPLEEAFAYGVYRFQEKYGVEPTILAIHPDLEYNLDKDIEVIRSEIISKKALYFGRPGYGHK